MGAARSGFLASSLRVIGSSLFFDSGSECTVKLHHMGRLVVVRRNGGLL